MNNRQTQRRQRHSGMTLVEMTVVVAIFSIVMITIHTTLFSSLRGFSAASTAQGLEDMGRTALDQIKMELAMSSVVTHPDTTDEWMKYPFAWHLGAVPANPTPEDKYDYAADLTETSNPANYAGGPFAHYATDLAQDLPVTTVGNGYMENDPAADISSALAFVTPICDSTLSAEVTIHDPHDSSRQLPMRWVADELGRWTPRICWGARLNADNMYTNVSSDQETVFYLRNDPGNDGNVLIRRVYDRKAKSWMPNSERELCRYVERIRFEPGEPNNLTVRVSIFLRKRDEAGRWMAADLTTDILMRGRSEAQEAIE